MIKKAKMMKKPNMAKNKPMMNYGKPKMMKKPMAKFPDLSGDGKVTKKDILMGRGVIDKPKMLKKKRKDIAGKAMMSYAKPNMAMKKKPAMAKDKPMMSKKKPKKPKKINKTVSGPKGTGKHHTMTRVNTKKGKATVKEVSKKKADRISKRNLNKGIKAAEKGYKK